MPSGKISYDELLLAIHDGGSVLVDGQIIDKAYNLPSRADYAKGDPIEEANVLAELKASLAKQQEQVATLQAALDAANAPKGEEVPAEGGEPTVLFTEEPADVKEAKSKK